jgi:hypothetical protein
VNRAPEVGKHAQPRAGTFPSFTHQQLSAIDIDKAGHAALGPAERAM